MPSPEKSPMDSDKNDVARGDEGESSFSEKGEDNTNPFHWMLQCQRQETGHRVLEWYSPRSPTTVAQEEVLLGSLLRYGKKERGMMCRQNHHRKKEIKRLCNQHQVPLSQALSLRRHHIKQLNSNQTMTALGLGRVEDIRRSAQLFEICIANFLKGQQVAFFSEQDQKRHIREHRRGRPFPPTPDFILGKEIIIQKYSNKNHDTTTNKKKRHRSGETKEGRTITILEKHKICWIEAKMFYGASTIEHDGKSAVGCLRNTARKYVQIYGPGAFIFLQGCGERLQHDLELEGVIVLDCSGGLFSLEPVFQHQRTWCADKNGEILP